MKPFAHILVCASKKITLQYFAHHEFLHITSFNFCLATVGVVDIANKSRERL